MAHGHEKPVVAFEIEFDYGDDGVWFSERVIAALREYADKAEAMHREKPGACPKAGEPTELSGATLRWTRDFLPVQFERTLPRRARSPWERGL